MKGEEGEKRRREREKRKGEEGEKRRRGEEEGRRGRRRGGDGAGVYIGHFPTELPTTLNCCRCN